MNSNLFWSMSLIDEKLLIDRNNDFEVFIESQGKQIL